MYKATSKNMQKARGRSWSWRANPKADAKAARRANENLRAKWWGIVAAAVRDGSKLSAGHQAKIPDWLRAEIVRVTPQRWLARWDRKRRKSKR